MPACGCEGDIEFGGVLCRASLLSFRPEAIDGPLVVADIDKPVGDNRRANPVTPNFVRPKDLFRGNFSVAIRIHFRQGQQFALDVDEYFVIRQSGGTGNAARLVEALSCSAVIPPHCIASLGVKPWWRKRGIALNLVRYAASLVARNVYITLDDMSDRYRQSHNLYVTLGFRYVDSDGGPEMYARAARVAGQWKIRK